MLQQQSTTRLDLDDVPSIYSQPYHEACLYHNEQRHGYFTLSWSTRSGRRTVAESYEIMKYGPEVGSNLWVTALRDPDWQRFVRPLLGQSYKQKSFPLSELGAVLNNVWSHIPMTCDDSVETTSVWISQAEFSRPNRQKINLAHISVCWVDIDLRHENSPLKLQSMTEDRALALVLARCQDQGIPEPSIILWTGRGLAVKWLIDVLPKVAYPRWAAVQKCLVEAFADLGSDASARDASRVLRLPGTYNPKSGGVCLPIHVNSFWGDPIRILFNDLADAVLPFTREQLQILKKERLENPVRKRLLEHRLKVLDGGQNGTDNLVKFNPVRLAWLQVDDYRKLAELKPIGSRPEGWTNSIVWMATSALAMAVWGDADRWNEELNGLISELAPPLATIKNLSGNIDHSVTNEVDDYGRVGRT